MALRQLVTQELQWLSRDNAMKENAMGWFLDGGGQEPQEGERNKALLLIE